MDRSEDPSNQPPTGPPPSYDEVQAMSGGAPAFQGQPAPYAPYPTQEAFKYDGYSGVAPYPTQLGFPTQTGAGQVPYPTQPGAQYPYGAPQVPGVYPLPPPGTATYNTQGGVAFIGRNQALNMAEIQRRRKIFMFIFVFMTITMVFYLIARSL